LTPCVYHQTNPEGGPVPDIDLKIPAKFQDPHVTAKGERRAWVDLTRLRTLWFNTGTLCNLTCRNCYIDSSPRNDRLVYLSVAEVSAFLDEITREGLGTEEIGLTGGEPFLNPDIIPILDTSLSRGFRVLVLTNAMRPMMKLADPLRRLKDLYGPRLTLRVSLDHYDPALHEEERGERTWAPTIEGLAWLSANGFRVHAAGRTRWGGAEADLRRGFAALFAEQGIAIDAWDREALVLFPEMDEQAEVPEITTACWDILGKHPDSLMCAGSRMVVKRKGDAAPSVQAYTLLAYDQRFNLGTTLAEAARPVPVNHPHCAKFCVLGGGSCTAG